jgi:hypothetical protein
VTKPAKKFLRCPLVLGSGVGVDDHQGRDGLIGFTKKFLKGGGMQDDKAGILQTPPQMSDDQFI